MLVKDLSRGPSGNGVEDLFDFVVLYAGESNRIRAGLSVQNVLIGVLGIMRRI